MELAPSIRALALGFYRDPVLRRTYTADDLIQEVYLRALRAVDRGFKVEYSFKAYVLQAARNHLLGLARSAGRASKPQAVDLTSHHYSEYLAREEDLDYPAHLRKVTTALLGWLRENPDEIEDGWVVLNLMLWNHGNHDRVALVLTIQTDRAWTCERVRSVVRKIKKTELGEALCDALKTTPMGGKSAP